MTIKFIKSPVFKKTQLIHSILRKDTAKNILNGSNLLLVLYLLVGLVFRLFLANFAFREPLYDQYTYLALAGKIAGGNIATDCCTKGPGYSMLIAIVYLLFGMNNYPAVRTVQIFIDLGTAVLLYLTAQKIFNRKVAFFSFLAYVFNPFTGPYSGLLLPEIITLFYIALIAYIICRENFKKSLLSWFSLGIILGLLVLTRLSFYYFVLSFMLLLFILMHKRIKQILFLVIMLFGFIIGTSYALIGNYLNWHTLTIIPPYSITAAGIYTNFNIKGFYPEVITDVNSESSLPEGWSITDEYSNTPLEKWKDLENKYRTLFWRRMQKEWPVFIRSKIRSALMLWDKRYLYYYFDPIYPRYSLLVRAYNIVFLGLAGLGFIYFLKRKDQNKIGNALVVFTVYLFLYMTFFFPLLSNESRHTLPFYVLIFLWSGYGACLLWDKIKGLARG